jgi:hypothetical protein
MGQCFLYGNGVGSQLLYDVVCQTAEPAKKEGRIWIKSAVPMTYVEWNNNPWSGGAVGRVDIMGTLGGSNPTSSNNIIEVFNTKVSGILHQMKVTPYRCQQVQGSTGNWVNVDAYICHSNTWVQFSSTWNGELFDNGNQYEDMTGGWSIDNTYYGGGSIGTALVGGSWGNNPDQGSRIYTNKAIQIGHYNTFKFTVTEASGNNVFYLKSGSISGANMAYNAFHRNIGTFAIAIPSGSTSLYPYLQTGSKGTCTITKVWLE